MTEKKGGAVCPAMQRTVSAGFVATLNGATPPTLATGATVAFGGYSGTINTNEFLGSTNTYTVTHGGYYMINAQITFPASGSGTFRTLSLLKNGSATGLTDTLAVSATLVTQPSINGAILLASGDAVKLTVAHDVGSATAYTAAYWTLMPVSEKPWVNSLT